jgi:hypothetical protein
MLADEPEPTASEFVDFAYSGEVIRAHFFPPSTLVLLLLCTKVVYGYDCQRRSIVKNFLQEKVAETTKQKEEKRKKPKPEEHERMPEHEQCPLAKHRGDRNPKYHEERLSKGYSEVPSPEIEPAPPCPESYAVTTAPKSRYPMGIYLIDIPPYCPSNGLPQYIHY